MTPADQTAISKLTDVPPRDDHLIGLATLLDRDRIREILSSRRLDPSIQINNCTVSYVRYKPQTNCLVAYEVQYVDSKSEETVNERFFGKCYLQVDFQNAVDKATFSPEVANSMLPTVITLEDQHSIIYNCRADRTLDSLPLLFDPRKLVRLLYRVLPQYDKDTWRISDKRLRSEVVRFKPEKRALVRITSRVTHRATREKKDLSIYVRHYSGNQGQIVYDNMRDLQTELGGLTNITVPEPLAYLPDKRILLLNGVPGERLSDLLAGPLSRDILRRTARALANLHVVAVPNVQQRTTGDLLKDAEDTAASLKCLMPETRPMIDKVLAWLQELNASTGPRGTFVHGDFYYDQVLVRNNAVAILDFDRSYRGDPLADVGNFCAHLLLMGRRQHLSEAAELADAFVDEYFSCTELDADRRRLQLWTIFGLFQLAVSPFRIYDKAWRTKTLDILDLVGKLYHETQLSE